MKLTDGFCVSLRASFQPGRMGEICLISKASTMGGGTAPRKNCLQICTASGKLTLSADSKMAARNDTFVKPFFELLRKNITKKSSYHLIPDGRRIRQLNLLTLAKIIGFFFFIAPSLSDLMFLKPKPCKGKHNRSKYRIQNSPHGKCVQDKPAKLIGDIFSNLRHGGTVRE